jgi:preprotein translocase subunit SecE
MSFTKNQVTWLLKSSLGLSSARDHLYQEVVAEMKKVTWPDRQQVRQLSIGVIILSLFIGAVIALMDLIFQGIFVRALPSLLGG